MDAIVQAESDEEYQSAVDHPCAESHNEDERMVRFNSCESVLTLIDGRIRVTYHRENSHRVGKAGDNTEGGSIIEVRT